MNNIRMEVTNPDDVVITLTASAKLSEWKSIRESIDTNHWGGEGFGYVIRDMVLKAEKSFYPDIP